jgi:hypothetical protein
MVKWRIDELVSYLFLLSFLQLTIKNLTTKVTKDAQRSPRNFLSGHCAFFVNIVVKQLSCTFV